MRCDATFGVVMESTLKLLIDLVRSEITGEKLNLPKDFTFNFDQLIRLAKNHEISQIVSDSLIKNGVITEEKQLKIAQEQIYYASYRNTKNEYILNLVYNTLEKAHIEHIPLKGAISRNLYPETWMRMSCDIDILVPQDKFYDAINALKEIGFTVSTNVRYHDVSLILSDVNLELHFSLCENVHGIDNLLKEVWKYAIKDTDYRYYQTNDYFVFHHIAHMVHHFLTGGCGIRPLIDFWILKRSDFFDETKVREYCKKARILDFYDAICETVDGCFFGKEITDIAERVLKYLSVGGAYGSFSNNAATYTILNDGKIKFIIRMAFPSYENMKMPYPILNKMPVLLPFCYIHRIFKKIFGKRSKVIEKVKIVEKMDQEFLGEVERLIHDLKIIK